MPQNTKNNQGQKDKLDYFKTLMHDSNILILIKKNKNYDFKGCGL